MNIFIDTISSDSHIILFNNDRQIVDRYNWQAKGKESSTLLPNIDSIISRNNLTYSNLENIVVVHGPGSFTGVRTTCLVVNTMNFVLGKNITAITYFDMFDNYPVIKSSSKKDCFFKKNSNSDIQIISNDDIEEVIKNNKIQSIYGDSKELSNLGIEIFDNIDYSAIISKIEFQKNKRINPLYIKKPNIS